MSEDNSTYHWIFDGIIGSLFTFLGIWQNKKSKRERDQVERARDLEISNQRIEQQNSWIENLKKSNNDLSEISKAQLIQIKELQQQKEEALIALHRKEIEDQKKFNIEQFNKIKK